MGLLRLTGEGRSAVLLQLLGGEAVAAGPRLIVSRDGADLSSQGSLGDEALDEAAQSIAHAALSNEHHSPSVVILTDTAGGKSRVFVEVHDPAESLIVVGAGHIAQPLSRMGVMLGMEVTVLDDRPDWADQARFPEASRVLQVDFNDPFVGVGVHRRTHVVLVTRGHRYDYECLVRLLRLDPPPAYIGMIGSRRRVRATFAQLGADGFEPEAASRVWAPIGLDIGAQSPAEIAVAVAAEIILSRKGGAGGPLRDRERVAKRFMASDAQQIPPRKAEPT